MTLVISSMMKLMDIKAETMTANDESKNRISTRNNVIVLVSGAAAAASMIASFSFFSFKALYTSPLTRPARAPLTMHTPIVMIGWIASIVAPDGSAPVATMIATTIPNTVPVQRRNSIHALHI